MVDTEREIRLARKLVDSLVESIEDLVEKNEDLFAEYDEVSKANDRERLNESIEETLRDFETEDDITAALAEKISEVFEEHGVNEDFIIKVEVHVNGEKVEPGIN